MAEKLGGIGWLFSKFGFLFLLLQDMKSSSIYRGWKRMFGLHWCQILAFGSTKKNPSRWLKVTIMGCQVFCRKMAGWVGHFGVVPPSLWCQSAKTEHNEVQ
jgi:hypothetical protein